MNSASETIEKHVTTKRRIASNTGAESEVTLTDAERRHVIRSVTTVAAAFHGDNINRVTVNEFIYIARQMFPCLGEADLSKMLDNFDEAKRAAVSAAAEDEKELLAEPKFFETNEEDWNEKSCAAFNSLAPMLGIMERAQPLTRRNFQACVQFIREQIKEELAWMDSADYDKTVDPVADRGMVYRLLDMLFNPRTTEVKGETDKDGEWFSQRLANNASLIDTVFGKDIAAAALREKIFRVLLTDSRKAPTKRMLMSEMMHFRAPGAATAAFVGFLSSLTNPGVRQSIMQLVSTAHPAGTAKAEDLLLRDQNGVPKDTGLDTIVPEVGGRAEASVDAIAEPFLFMSDLSHYAVEALNQEYLAAVERHKAEFVKPFPGFNGDVAAFRALARKSVSVGGDEGSSSRRYTVGVENTVYIRALGAFKHNCSVLAAIMDDTLGRGNSLSRMLRSEMLFNGMYRAIKHDLSTSGAATYASQFAMFMMPDRGTRPPVLTYLFDGLFNLFAETAKERAQENFERTKSRAYHFSREEISNIVQLAYTTGGLQGSSIGSRVTTAASFTEMLYLHNMFTSFLPQTVVLASKPANPKTYREANETKHVAVCARAPIPSLVAYMKGSHQDPSDPFSFESLATEVALDKFREDFVMQDPRLAGVGVTQESVTNIRGAIDRKKFTPDYAVKIAVLFPSVKFSKTGYVVGEKSIGALPGESEAALKARFAKDFEDMLAVAFSEMDAYAYGELEKAGGSRAIVNGCLQSMTWPDAGHTPILARNVAPDFSPEALYAAALAQYEKASDPVKAAAHESQADEHRIWFVNLYSGDHSCNNLLQVPLRRPRDSEGNAIPYRIVARAINAGQGLDKLGRQTKRSAISSSDAPSVPFAACDITFDYETMEPRVSNPGECRIHVVINPNEVDTGKTRLDENGNEVRIMKPYNPEFIHGQTLVCGYGAETLRRMSKDPAYRILKFHAIGSGRHPTFIKSASTVVGEGSGFDGGTFRPSTFQYVLQQYVLGYVRDGETPEKRRKRSTDIVTDEDSYKVGALTAVMVSGGAVAKTLGFTEPMSVLSYVKAGIKGGMTPAQILGTTVTLEDGTETKLSDIAQGLDIQEIKGFPGDKPSYALSYADNTIMGGRVANIAHRADNDSKYNGRNYTVDEMTRAVTFALAEGGLDNSASAELVVNALTNYSMLSAIVATHEDSIRAAIESDPRLKAIRDGEFDTDGEEYRTLLAQVVSKRITKEILCPVCRQDAVLVSCGATIDEETQTVIDSSPSPMRRDVHKGSIVFADEETQYGALYAGFKRRLALAEVNCTSIGIRYGLFLDEESLLKDKNLRAIMMRRRGYTHEADAPQDRNELIMQILESAFEEIRDATAKHVQYIYAEKESAKRAKESKDDPVAQSTHDTYAENLKKVERRAKLLREVLFGHFYDHHGFKASTIEFKMNDGTVFRPCHLYVVEDLFIHDGDKGRFDRSAVYMATPISDDRVTLDTRDEDGNVNDKCPLEGKKCIFLAGEAFNAPRTPSYNATCPHMVRASFPVTERRLQAGKTPVTSSTGWQSGSDAMVAMSPDSLAILGSDNDGDESALGFFEGDNNGFVSRFTFEHFTMFPEGLLDFDKYGAAATVLGNLPPDIRPLMVKWAKQYRTPDHKPMVVRGKGSNEYRVSIAARRAFGNSLQAGLLAMAHDLPVPPGTGRRLYASPESTLVKSRPFDDVEAYWDDVVAEMPPRPVQEDGRPRELRPAAGGVRIGGAVEHSPRAHRVGGELNPLGVRLGVLPPPVHPSKGT